MRVHAKKFQPLLLKFGLPVLALSGAALWLSESSKAEQSAPVTVTRPALTVRTVALQEDKWARTLTANGSILPWQEAVISAQMQGVRIADVKASIGDRVRQGDVLVTLNNSLRADDKGPEGIIVAPDDGIISAANANVGSMVQQGAELFRLIRKGRLEWRAELTADELMLLRRGMPVSITVGEGRVVKGVVRAISPMVNSQTRYGYALVALEDSDGIIAGAYARGTFDISGGKKAVQFLPQSAVLQRGNQAYVLTIGEGNHVHEQPVSLGQRFADHVQIRQGLKPGVPVIESGGAFLTEGDVVQVVQ